LKDALSLKFFRKNADQLKQWSGSAATFPPNADGTALTHNADSAPPPKCVRKKGILISDALPNLVNGAGLPASPFRTDAFPMVTEGKF